MKRLDRLLTGVQKLVKISQSRLATATLVFSAFVVIFGQSHAVIASTVGEEFAVFNAFQEGFIVSINPNSVDGVELASLSTGQYSLGITNESADNVITYTKENGTISVALSGEVLVYVTDANGEVKKGDFIGVSWLEGVGMRALDNQEQKLLGVALEDFNSATAQPYGEIETSDGNKDVSVGTVKVRLFDKEGSVDATLSNLSGLESFANSLAGKSVDPLRVLAGSLIFIMGTALAGFFAYSSIKGSFISVGRNPMASASIYRNLIQVSMISVAALVIGATLAYVVLVV